MGPLPSAKTEKGDVPGINADGTYYWKLSSLSPSTVYYYQQSATVKGNKVPVKGSVANFNSNVGTTIVPGSAEEKADLNKRSYTLLSGFPNFSVLPDPDLCAQQRAAGENPRFCDMNDVINYFMKLLIGLCAVSLVFRIMYEGFVYMTSDMPFKVASAKSSLYAAILGLLLALTSYIILNTINPKLVDGTVSVDQLGIGVEIVGDGSTSFNLGTKTKGLPTPVYCPGSGGRAQLSKIAMSFQNNVVYNQTLRNSLQPNGKVALDCSSYVAQVLNCAGYTIPGVSTSNTNTASIFGGSGAEKISTISSANGVVTVNNKVLQVGDLLGWTGSKGHVVMYIGGGQIIEVHGPKGSITNAKVWPSIDWYQKNYGFKSVYRIPN
ncbi:MAG: NlpC/P60 family protein [Patescibacteria group bacterium]